MAAELLGLSKFKLDLLSLISEARDLRESERGAREKLRHCAQRQKQIECENDQKLQELRAEITSRDESIQKLENKIKWLENENALLEKREKEQKENVDGLLQSRDAFLSLYQDSTSGMRDSIEVRDRKITVLAEKINAHMLLIDSIRKEAAAVKHVVDSIQSLVSEKEQVVSGLKLKMEKVSTFEKDFVGKIHCLENKLGDYQHELRRRDSVIMKLKEQLEAEKMRSKFQPQVEELQKTLIVKEELIHSLTSEKQALCHQLQSLELILQRVQDIFSKMGSEKEFSSVLEDPEACEAIAMEVNGSAEHVVQVSISENKNIERDSKENADISVHLIDKTRTEACHEKHVLDSCQPMPSVYSSPQSVCSNPSSTTNVWQSSKPCNMDNNTLIVHRLDSEGSSNGVEQ